MGIRWINSQYIGKLGKPYTPDNNHRLVATRNDDYNVITNHQDRSFSVILISPDGILEDVFEWGYAKSYNGFQEQGIQESAQRKWGVSW